MRVSLFGVHFEWWQVVIAVLFVFTTLDRVASIAEHLGFLPVRLLTWVQQRWLRRIEEQARQRALDALLTNGITTKLDAVRDQTEANARQGKDTADLLAQHITEAKEDRRLAAQDRHHLQELYEHMLGDKEREGEGH